MTEDNIKYDTQVVVKAAHNLNNSFYGFEIRGTFPVVLSILEAQFKNNLREKMVNTLTTNEPFEQSFYLISCRKV